jgi:hypothetical protein
MQSDKELIKEIIRLSDEINKYEGDQYIVINFIDNIECINNDYLEEDLTVGKSYDVIWYDDEANLVALVNDFGVIGGYNKKCFNL